jgi:hypothetical protein
MTNSYLRLVGPEDVIEQVGTAQVADVEVGVVRPADPHVDAVDAPLGPEEIKAILQVVTLAFKTGAAALVFFKALLEILKKTSAPAPVKVEIREGRTNRHIATIDTTTNLDELIKKLPK